MQWFTSIGKTLKLDRIANIAKDAKDALWQTNCPWCKRPADKVLCKDRAISPNNHSQMNFL